MFENIGNTIKIMAKVFWWIGTITIVGILMIWPMAFVLYGFGELVEKQSETAKYIKASNKQQPKKEDKDELPEI